MFRSNSITPSTKVLEFGELIKDIIDRYTNGANKALPSKWTIFFSRDFGVLVHWITLNRGKNYNTKLKL